MGIDKDSYIVGAEIQSGINFDIKSGCHCILMGKGNSLAENITFLVDLNHDYEGVVQGNLSVLHQEKGKRYSARKGSILLQNDVWVGHGATIMSGVTLHNGCVVAAGSVVTKDVPPYGIVGGNPARVIRYRFNEMIIDAMQKISWWNWPEEMMKGRKKDFQLPIDEFVLKYLGEAEKRMEEVPQIEKNKRKIILFFPDLHEPFPLHPKILRQYFEKDRT